ncbi:MAG: SDR family oxidoreductase [Caldilineaceae bacterium]|nr:SDR family oxidoreductase [Caldilineaceae bacterium]HRJ43005.1 SDR family NAD(P)-dependent oxidoreductase [Caldilineaceae bacterium]
MQIDLSGKIALITGAAGGIGRACAQTLAEAGAFVVAVDLNEAGAQETVDLIGGGLALGCDLAQPDPVTALRERVIAETGGVDILVNCAGLIAYRRGINAVSVDEWDLLLNVNLRGTFLICQAFLDGMKERRGGAIVNFSSLAARVGGIEVGIHYAASKAALIGFTRTLAKEGGPFGITVNAVAPGVILTDPVRRQVAGHEEAYTAQIPLRRLGQPQDVANVVLFLVSPLSNYITGTVLDINGGMYMG